MAPPANRGPSATRSQVTAVPTSATITGVPQRRAAARASAIRAAPSVPGRREAVGRPAGGGGPPPPGGRAAPGGRGGPPAAAASATCAGRGAPPAPAGATAAANRSSQPDAAQPPVAKDPSRTSSPPVTRASLVRVLPASTSSTRPGPG